ncbi:VWA domain-containing protein [Spirilliplanes yamanashiensis]|uniref:Membrane protein n=1 Tax=Spirilliplanes yamanashiensis TaxID=42233 RepID=A0A8J3Y8I5_9ACTN|nr:VWA domain-containing protein [Spirilliplanes yamanashiensis]MDP9817142.1 Ca-activated chloride channel family protein [Spirilliplanes yamanashiensis]GIJ03205.1 membrane protein [Spirilliplanes yamanashiensis]
MIRFLQPWWLLSVLPVLAVAAVYVWRQFRKRQYAIRFTNVDMLRTLAPKGLGWRRHASAAALLLALFALSGAMARPSVDTEQPLERATVILAIDVSLSMQADDVAPNRIEAAQEAAKQFVAELPADYNLGLVSFAKSANVLVAPTKDRAAVTAAIDGLTLAEATATGEAVFTSLEAIRSVPSDGANELPPARIVLLSDGYRTSGRSVEDAGAAASAANVPVSTIAFGTDAGMVDIRGAMQRVPVDRASLEQLAETTKGFFYEAASVTELKQVYEDMGSSIGHRVEPREVTQWYAGTGLLLGLLAAGLSLAWSSRLP